MEREFEDAELRMLIDSVLFSKNLTKNQAKILVEKLKKLGNRYFPVKVTHISNLPNLHHGDNKQLMYAVDTVNEAISLKKKISFVYNRYGTDFKLHPRRKEEYIVNPYQMVANNGWFYLIANYDKYDDVSHYRLDKMTSVKIIDEKVKPMSQVKGLERGFNLPKHMAEHIYMFCGESVHIKMLADGDLMNELVDWFGKDFSILEERRNGRLLISLKCNENAFFYWALQFGLSVEVLEPEGLRGRIAEAVEIMNEKYHSKG
jgi:predicted DNA-binding transcriptional regulator YafY